MKNYIINASGNIWWNGFKCYELPKFHRFLKYRKLGYSSNIQCSAKDLNIVMNNLKIHKIKTNNRSKILINEI